jgi:hypothetical protein
MSNNSYDDIKNGIKTDVKEIGASLFLVGGLLILVVIMLTVLAVAINDKEIDANTRRLMGGGVVILGIFMIANKKVLTFILQVWLLLIAAVIILPMFALAFYFIYLGFTGK